MTQLNEQQLAQIADSSKTAEAFFEYARSRQREVRDGVSSIDGVRNQMAHNGFHAVSSDLKAMFRALHKAGIGELKGGMFKWNASLKEIGDMAKEAATTEGVPVDDIKRANKVGVIGKPILPPKEVHIVMALGKGREVHISFSKGLSAEECKDIYELLLKSNNL